MSRDHTASTLPKGMSLVRRCDYRVPKNTNELRYGTLIIARPALGDKWEGKGLTLKVKASAPLCGVHDIHTPYLYGDQASLWKPAP